jgi:hypothetical protein
MIELVAAADRPIRPQDRGASQPVADRIKQLTDGLVGKRVPSVKYRLSLTPSVLERRAERRPRSQQSHRG